MDIYDLKEMLIKNKSYSIFINGLINTKLIINNINFTIAENDFIIKDNIEDVLSINKHQIMKIIHNSDNSIEIFLDQLLKITLIPK